MTTTMRPTYLLDAVVRAERKHEATLIASVLELDGSAWPGEGAAADVGRLQVARRIAWARWLAEVGEINEADY